MKLLEILLGQIPEAIYFALFMIYSKKLENKRLLFISLMILEYTLIMETLRFKLWAHILVFISTFLLLKMLYKEKAQITDIFILAIASLILITICGVSYLFILNIFPEYLISLALTRILMFTFLFIFKNKLYKIQNLYKKLWNRNDKVPKKIKSTTFRSLNVVIFNTMFFLINLGIIFILLHGGE